MNDSLSSAHQSTQHISPPGQTQSTRLSSLIPLISWIAILFGSALTRVFWVEGLGYKEAPLWDYIARFCVLLVLLALSWLWPVIRPLRGFLLALVAFNLGFDIQVAVSNLPQVRGLPPVLYVLTTALLSFLSLAFMALTLIGSGLSRQDLFLAKGNMRAKSGISIPLLSSLRWTVLGPLAFAILAIPLIIELFLQVHPNFALAHNILNTLPIIVIFGILNATQEEFTYRSVYLARLTPVVSTGQALLITSVNFGINHWVRGHPNGLAGVVTVILAGYLLARSMIDTRGSAWAWILHIGADILVAVLLAMASSV